MANGTQNFLSSLFGGNQNQNVAPELEERQNILQKGVDKVSDFIGSAIYDNPLSRVSDITSFVETDEGATGFTADNKKVSNLNKGELDFLKKRNEDQLREQTGFGQPVISGTPTDDAKFKLYDPLKDYMFGEGSTGVYGNRAAQNMMMQQQVAGEPIVDALLRQRRADAQAPSLESLRAVAMAPSRAEQEAFSSASARREADLRRDELLRRAERSIDPEERAAIRASAFGQAPTQDLGIMDQLSPTQLTYLMGQLGYDITPKPTAKPKDGEKAVPLPAKPEDMGQAVPLPAFPDDTDARIPLTSPSTAMASPLSALDLVRTFKPTFNVSELSGDDLSAYNYAINNPNDPRSKQILMQLGAL
jgi:hypothetical protein